MPLPITSPKEPRPAGPPADGTDPANTSTPTPVSNVSTGAGRQTQADMLAREAVANKPKHWVRAVTACNSKCLFCLDADTPRNVFIPPEEVKADLLRGREELGAEKVVISGGEASLHPQFMDFVAYANEIGYDRVQTVTNGYRFGEPDFMERALDAGLGEITYSIHGHNAKLHDHLTQTRGAFKRITRAIAHSIRDGRPVVNVDVCINKQNVGTLDKLMDLCIQLGVTEFDLLHVIPQSNAFDNRNELFYDPAEYIDTLHRVFRLNRHPRYVVWTNRFPVPFLEGLEDLIQDPHKMLDEINGRRFQVRRYLDAGEPLDCRDPERCQHCFIEPMCNTVDGVIRAQHEDDVEVWDIGQLGSGGPLPEFIDGELPFGASLLRVGLPAMSEQAHLDTFEQLGSIAFCGGWLIAGESAPALDAFESIRAPRSGGAAGRPVVLEARSPAQLDAWLGEDPLPADVSVDVVLNQQTARWLADHHAALERHAAQLRIHQPSFEKLAEARDNDVRRPAAFFKSLPLRLRVSGLPACLAPGMQVINARRTLGPHLFEPDTGRLSIRETARHHIIEYYASKSLRCRDCAIDELCEGAHINQLRDRGLKQLRPIASDDAQTLADAQARYPNGIPRLRDGAPHLPAAPSLPGFAPPETPPEDPLALIAAEQLLKRKRRRMRNPNAS